MRTEHDSPRPRRALPELQPGEAFGSALSSGLDVPLSALRASLEALEHRLPAGHSDQGLVECALEELQDIGRNVRGLLELVAEPTLMPMRCTTSEIARTVVTGLPPAQRNRVLVARDQAEETVCLDAPLLSRSVRRLVENALEATQEDILVVARHEGDQITFRILNRCGSDFDSKDARAAFRSTKRRRMGLGLTLTERDLELMGGTLELSRSLDATTVATLTVPIDDETERQGSFLQGAISA